MQATRPLTKPAKQRKTVYQAPDHVRHRLLAAHLSAELRTSHGLKSLPVRSGDTVHVMRGDHKGVEGKITSVDLAKYKIYVEGLTREKVDGTTISVPVHPSKVIVTRLSLDDKWRKEILDSRRERRRGMEKVTEKPKQRAKVEEKPIEELVEKPKEVVEAVAEEVVEEKPALEEKPSKKRVAKPKKRAPRKKVLKKAKAEVTETEKEDESKPKKRTRTSGRKTSKKTEGRE